MTVNVGIAGLGKMGLLHLRNTRFIDDIRIVAVADQSSKGLAEAKAFRARNYEDYTQLLTSKDLDAVIIALPNFLHEKSVVQAAENGLDIFVEKPLARTLSECENIRRAVQRNGVRLAVGHNYRYFDHVRKLKTAYDDGILGDVEMAHLEHFVNGPFAHPLEPVPIHDWWLDAQLIGGGALLDQGYHLVDLFRWFFGDPQVLYTYLGYRYNLGIEDSAAVVLQSKHTLTKGIISVGWFQKMVFPKFNFRIGLNGTARYLSTDHFVPSNLYLHAATEAVKNSLRRVLGAKIHPLSYTYYYASYFWELQHFFESIQAGSPDSPPNVEDGLQVVKVVEASYHLVKKNAKPESV